MFKALLKRVSLWMETDAFQGITESNSIGSIGFSMTLTVGLIRELVSLCLGGLGQRGTYFLYMPS
jgi:hypothetical protein